jgi:hypothetical protein
VFLHTFQQGALNFSWRPVDFISKYLKNNNRPAEGAWSTDYDWMSCMGPFARNNASEQSRKQYKIKCLPPHSKEANGQRNSTKSMACLPKNTPLLCQQLMASGVLRFLEVLMCVRVFRRVGIFIVLSTCGSFLVTAMFE